MESPEKKFASRIEARTADEVLAGKQEIIPYVRPVEFEPPMEMPIYEEFDAAKSFSDLKEEIAAMREKNLPPEERRGKSLARIGEIRERLRHQEKGIAEAIKTLLSAIEKNPDDNDRELFGRVAELAPTYHFSNNELRDFWNAIVEYRKKHSRVERTRSEYPDDAALFEACFGRKPEGRVVVEKRPMMLYFRCYDDRDYVTAFNVDEIGGDEKKLTEEMWSQAFATAGRALHKVRIKELDSVVAIERTSTLVYNALRSPYVFNQKQSRETRAHEEQHMVNKLFRPIISRVEEEKAMADIARTAKTVGEGRHAMMKAMARVARRTMGIDDAARDEILAHYKDGAAPKIISRNVTKLAMYDYRNKEDYKGHIAKLPGDIAEAMTKTMSVVEYIAAAEAGGEEKSISAKPLETDVAEVEPYVEEAFGDDYKKDVVRWIGAIEALESKGYSRDDIVAMLYGERVHDWVAFARRMTGKQEQKPESKK